MNGVPHVFVCKFDLLKGYWQVPLTDRVKEVSAFCTPDAPDATFQRMVNHIVADIEGCEAYVDDLIVYSQTWEQQIDWATPSLVREIVTSQIDS